MNRRLILDKLWAARRHRPVAPTKVGDLVRGLQKEVKVADAACAELAAFWSDEIPEVMAKVKSIRMAMGVVTVTTTDAGTAYLLARLLRSKLEQQTKRACRTPIKRIKAVAG